MTMDLVHITSYVDPETFAKMERVRKARVRTTRSQWVNEAIAEKAEREAQAKPDSDSPKRKHS